MRPCALALLLAACGAPKDDPFGEGDARPDAFLFDVGGGFWDAPFPSDHRVRQDTRRVDLSGFPGDGAFVDSLVELVDDRVQGWSPSGAVYLPLSVEIDASRLPTLAGSVESDARVFLVDVHEDGEGRGTRHPIRVEVVQGDAHGPALALAALPLPGVPLKARRRYALVVDRSLQNAAGIELEPPPEVEALLAGEAPEGWRADVADQYLDALRILEEDGVDPAGIAGLTVFTTSRPSRELARFVDHARQGVGLRVTSPVTLVEQHPDFCLVTATFDAPIYQAGTAPYEDEGGTFVLDDDGLPVEQDPEREYGIGKGRVFVTIPRHHGVQATWPVVLFVRAGGGGDRPLVDHGPRTEAGVDVQGTGYAAELARAGWAGVQFDGPVGGPDRNPLGLDEDARLVDLARPAILRDSLQQAIIELALAPGLVDSISVRPPVCGLPETASVYVMRPDHERIVVFAHGVGAGFATIAAALEPSFPALILSGAGGSWIERVLHDDDLRATAADLLGVAPGELHALHPGLTLLQWAQEPVDPAVYGAMLRPAARPEQWPHVLMVQGVPDATVPSAVAQAASLSMGVDLAGPSLDGDASTPLASVLPLAGGRALALPAGLNRAAGTERHVTRVIVQHPGDDVEDGHTAIFQQEAAHEQVACFLQGLWRDGDVGDAPLVSAGVPGGCPDAPPGAE